MTSQSCKNYLRGVGDEGLRAVHHPEGRRARRKQLSDLGQTKAREGISRMSAGLEMGLGVAPEDRVNTRESETDENWIGVTKNLRPEGGRHTSSPCRPLDPEEQGTLSRPVAEHLGSLGEA
jgi:hypothetical protein